MEPFIFDREKGGTKEDAFHFIAYIQHKNKVYELDGLQEGPTLLAELDQN